MLVNTHAGIRLGQLKPGQDMDELLVKGEFQRLIPQKLTVEDLFA